MGKTSGNKIGSISNISGSTINIVGRDLIQIQNDPDTELQQEFNVLVSEVINLVSKSGLDKMRAKEISSNLQTVQSQIGNKKPNKTVILSRLWGVAEVLSTVSGAATGVQMLNTMVQRAIEIANNFLK